MSEFMQAFIQQCKDEKLAGSKHYSKAFTEATEQKGQYRYIPKESKGISAMYSSTEKERAAIYGLGLPSKAYDLYNDKNEHS